MQKRVVAHRAGNAPWQLQAAKARFSEVFQRARTEGPQRVARNGKEEVVILAVEEYDRLMRRVRRPESIVEFFQSSPLVGIDWEFPRSRELPRNIEL